MTLGFSLFLIAVGAILRFAVTATVVGIDIQTVGVILMIVGAIGFVISLVLTFNGRSAPPPPPTADDLLAGPAEARAAGSRPGGHPRLRDPACSTAADPRGSDAWPTSWTERSPPHDRRPQPQRADAVPPARRDPRAGERAPRRRPSELPGTLVFADVAGFTRLSERLARIGARGRRADQRRDRHVVRRAARRRLRERRRAAEVRRRRAAAAVRGRAARRARVPRGGRACARALRGLGPPAPGARTPLRMSIGVHTGTVHLFLAGRSHREPVVRRARRVRGAADGARGRRRRRSS